MMEILEIGAILFAILFALTLLLYSHYAKHRREQIIDELMKSSREALADCAMHNKRLITVTGEAMGTMTNFILSMIRVVLQSDESDQTEHGPELEFSVAWDNLPRAVVVRIVEEFGEDVADRLQAEGF